MNPATIHAIAAPRQRRGKSLARRTYQQGHVFQKGRKQTDQWQPDETAYVRWWRDVPGQDESKRDVVSLGLCRTRTIAKRRASDKLEQLGINSTQHFIEATSSITFREQGEQWLKSLANRKRNPLEQSTINNRRYYLDKWIYPFFENTHLADINNRSMKEFVETLATNLAAATIRDYSNIVKSVVASAVNEDGEEIFPRKWNEEYIDAPLVRNQNQPSTNDDSVTEILIRASGQYRCLFALLAGCGPLRVGEALGLEIDKHISSDFRTLHIRQKAKGNIIQPYLKTKSGMRDIDLCTSLSDLLREFVADRKAGLLFCSLTGKLLLQTNVLRRQFHPILKKMNHVKGGFNIFRRFRITHLDKLDCPNSLKHFWSGHAAAHISERYTKLFNEREHRLDWAERLGMGFSLDGIVGQPGTLEWFQSHRKSLDLVDETGVEPATSSLRTIDKIN